MISGWRTTSIRRRKSLPVNVWLWLHLQDRNWPESKDSVSLWSQQKHRQSTLTPHPHLTWCSFYKTEVWQVHWQHHKLINVTSCSAPGVTPGLQSSGLNTCCTEVWGELGQMEDRVCVKCADDRQVGSLKMKQMWRLMTGRHLHCQKTLFKTLFTLSHFMHLIADEEKAQRQVGLKSDCCIQLKRWTAWPAQFKHRSCWDITSPEKLINKTPEWQRQEGSSSVWSIIRTIQFSPRLFRHASVSKSTLCKKQK